MEKIDLILRGPGGEYAHISKDIKTLVNERIRSLELSLMKQEPFGDKTFTIKKDNDIHTNLASNTVRHDLKRYYEPELTQFLRGSEISKKVEKELDFYQHINAETEQFRDPELNLKHHLIDSAKSPRERAIENYAHFQRLKEDMFL